MKLPINRIRAESNIKRIKKQLQDIEEKEAQAKLQPMEQANDTFVIRTFAEEKKRLQTELEKNEKKIKEDK